MASKVSEEDFLAEIRAIADAKTIFVRAECTCGEMHASASRLQVDGRTILAIQQPREQMDYQHILLRLYLPEPEYAVYERAVDEFGRVGLRMLSIVDGTQIASAIFSDGLDFALSGDSKFRVQ